MIEFLPLILTGLGLAASIVYYANILNNANKTRELQLKAQELALKNQELQLETRQAQLFMQMFSKASSKEGIESSKILSNANWTSHEEWLEKYQNDPEYAHALTTIVIIMEGLGVLIKENLVDIKLLALLMAGSIRMTWEKHRDIIYEERKRLNYRRYASEWEYVYNALMKYLQEHPELAT